MFSLIISIIAIALVAALALASIYYGGAAFHEGSADAEASTAVNQGQQIQAAITMADINEEWSDKTGEESNLDDLGEYLKEIPKLRDAVWTVPTNRNIVTVRVINEDICKKIEEKGNAAFSGTLVTDATIGDDQPFGCVAADLGGTAGAGFPTQAYSAYYKI
ncbi:hypothetical protein RJD39_03940 [Vibrio scophthalmi]|uniref:hypothetical protein n=1 Tax=Vibrio scophthalmi TaxID=45658 RepID=UPI003873B3F0